MAGLQTDPEGWGIEGKQEGRLDPPLWRPTPLMARSSEVAVDPGCEWSLHLLPVEKIRSTWAKNTGGVAELDSHGAVCLLQVGAA